MFPFHKSYDDCAAGTNAPDDFDAPAELSTRLMVYGNGCYMIAVFLFRVGKNRSISYIMVTFRLFFV